MKLGLLHLTDIHIADSTDKVFDVGGSIAKACFSSVRQCDEFIIVVTGDIAYSGQQSEYELAAAFFREIKSKLESESGKKVSIFVAPGNHDCVLKPLDKVRNTIIDQIVSTPSMATTREFTALCTANQKQFFKFQKDISDIAPIFIDELWAEYEISVGASIVRISSLNASWMSRIPEVQGELVFPIEGYYEYLEAPSTLRLALIHQPLNWYCQSSYHRLKKALRTHSSAIFSGHEHSSGSEEVIDVSVGNVLLFEGAALQPHKGNFDPQFSCVIFDTDLNSVSEKRFRASKIHPLELQDISHALRASAGTVRNNNKIAEDFIRSLADAGGNFTHSDKKVITAEDIFLYPELEENSGEQEKKYLFADQLINSWETQRRALILGDDESGKSFLLRRAFFDIHNQGGLPLYIGSADFSSVGSRELERKILSLAEEQYVNSADFQYSEKALKVALVDDLDRVRGSKNQAKLIEFLTENFGSVIVMASTRFQLNELIDASISTAFSEFVTYKIRPFGHVMRHKLIKKWCLLSELATKAEMDKRVHDVERLLSVILGKNLVPSKPIYLLILLQSCDQQQQADLQSSGFSQYYEYLIVKSLKDVGFSNDQLNEMFSYLSNLAWHYKDKGVKEVDAIELRRFNEYFSKEFTTVDYEERIRILEKAKILTQSGGYFRFSYSYIYFLFVGKYLADNLYRQEVKDLVRVYCKELYRKENANSVMFLTHHGNDPWVIDQVSEILNGCFKEYSPLEFNGDISSINSLVNATAKIMIDEINDSVVEENQLNSRRLADESNSNSSDHEMSDGIEAGSMSAEEKDAVISLSSNINLMVKTSEILGHITKNYYGSLGRTRKAHYLEQIFNGSLRTLKALFEEIVDQPEAFIAEIERNFKDQKPGLTASEYTENAKKITFQVVGMICTGFIARAGQIVSSDKIREDIRSLVEIKENNGFRLIGIASSLVHPGHIPFDEIDKLAKDTAGNTFAFKILQSLVFYHLHMFHTTDRDKQRLADLVSIGMSQSRAIDATTKKGKMIK